jgi:hypothetical protein
MSKMHTPLAAPVAMKLGWVRGRWIEREYVYVFVRVCVCVCVCVCV